MNTAVDTVTGEVIGAKGASPFDRLASAPGVITTTGHDLVKGPDFDDLTGVDLIITRITIRKGAARPQGSPWTSLDGGYLSAELTTNPVQRIKVVNRCRAAAGMEVIDDLGELSFDPGDSLVFNDGGTGIYRDIVAILHEEGYIAVPSGKANAPKGFSRFDTVPEEWEILKGDAIEKDDEPFLGYTTPILLHAVRGIRRSKPYRGDFPGEAVTRYLR